MYTIFVRLDCVPVMPTLGLPVAVTCGVSHSGLHCRLRLHQTNCIVTALADPAMPSELGEEGRVVGG